MTFDGGTNHTKTEILFLFAKKTSKLSRPSHRFSSSAIRASTKTGNVYCCCCCCALFLSLFALVKRLMRRCMFLLLHGFCCRCYSDNLFLAWNWHWNECISQFALKVCPFCVCVCGVLSVSFSVIPAYCEWRSIDGVSFIRPLERSIELEGEKMDFSLHFIWRILFSVIKH